MSAVGFVVSIVITCSRNSEQMCKTAQSSIPANVGGLPRTACPTHSNIGGLPRAMASAGSSILGVDSDHEGSSGRADTMAGFPDVEHDDGSLAIQSDVADSVSGACVEDFTSEEMASEGQTSHGGVSGVGITDEEASCDDGCTDLDAGIERLSVAFTWAHKVLQVLVSYVGESLSESLLSAEFNLSTHFSGIGAVEVALDMLEVASHHVLGNKLRLQVVSACDNNARCQGVLRARSNDAHIFADILDIFPMRSKSEWNTSLGFDVNVLQDAIMRSPLESTSLCVRHRQRCTYPIAPGDVSGSPCQLWSRAGRRAGVGDARVQLLIGWCCILRKTRKAIAIHENTPGFQNNILVSLLSDMYEIVEISTAPQDVGFPWVSRRRV